MRLKSLILHCIIILLLSCNSKEKSDILTIPVGIYRDTQLALSEISEKVEAIELEVTDASLIQSVSRVLCSPDFIIVQEWKSIMLFDRKGKFIRQIGSSGQGPGEYVDIGTITADFDSKKIFVYSSGGKFICYDFEGMVIKESPLEYFGRTYNPYMNYIDGKLLFLSESFITIEENLKSQRILFFINDELLKTDSILIRNIDLSHFEIGYAPQYDYITSYGNNTYLYYSVIIPSNIVSDTLYQFKNNNFIPHLSVKFNNRGLNSDGRKDIYIDNIYRSSSYIFTLYSHNPRRQFYFFCYDLKTGKSYNMKDGLSDDIYTGEKVVIRPFDNDVDKFYYLHTNFKEGEIDEPNPTLYVGTLKK